MFVCLLIDGENWRDKDDRSGYNYRGNRGRNYRGRGRRGRGASRGGYRYNRPETDFTNYQADYTQVNVIVELP